MNIHQKVALIPLPHLRSFAASVGIPVTSDKGLAVNSIVKAIEDGITTLEKVKAHKFSYVPPDAPAVDTQGIDEAVRDAKSALTAAQAAAANSGRIDAEVKQLSSDIANISTKIADIKSEIGGAVARINRKVDSASVDDASIRKSVNAAVSEAFGKFRKAEGKQRIEQIAADLPPVRTVATAEDIFGDACQYGNTDFGRLNVELWAHPDAPAIVDDYVFQPEHLHQALLALSDELPDNVWLAGERGTGKTEFATQLAARLQRPLFRVNFDEALERADFIGANTIEQGSVVWKAGIIAKAIQTPGAIILLDEIGFARAQSIAVLHSLCERSPHRALTVSETGQRIPVASHVAFLCADNSNGHGDTSGNFAGVREQNSAFIDRFSYTLRFEYLPADKEADLIARRTQLPLSAAQIIVRYATVARQKAASGVITQPPSLRQLFAWARSCQKGLPLQLAFNNAIINKFPGDCTAELQGIYLAEINEADFVSALGE